MVERGREAAVNEGAAGTTDRLNDKNQSVHPVLNRDTTPDIINLEGYDIDSELKQFLESPLVVDQLERVDTVYGVPATQTNAILDAILREDGPVAVNSLMDSIYFKSWNELKDTIFVIENRNLIETRTIDGEDYVAYHNGGLEAVRRARYRDSVTVHMVEDELDREPKTDPLAAKGDVYEKQT